MESGGGPPQSKTQSVLAAACEWREASWSAPVLWRFWAAAKISLLPATPACLAEVGRRRDGVGKSIRWVSKLALSIVTLQNSTMFNHESTKVPPRKSSASENRLVNPSSSHWGRKPFFQEVGMGKSLVFLLSAASQASVVEKSRL
jgi:hypothetical protein